MTANTPHLVTLSRTDLEPVQMVEVLCGEYWRGVELDHGEPYQVSVTPRFGDKVTAAPLVAGTNLYPKLADSEILRAASDIIRGAETFTPNDTARLRAFADRCEAREHRDSLADLVATTLVETFTELGAPMPRDGSVQNAAFAVADAVIAAAVKGDAA